MNIDNQLLDDLLRKAAENPRLRMNLDLRTSPNDNSQRMLNALLPGTQVAIHRHPKSTEDVFLLKGRIDEIIFNDAGEEIERHTLCPANGAYGCEIPLGAWHSIEVYEPSVIFEAKDCRYGEDGSEFFSI
jgi:cupin fold WbuC family metalloprotein